MNKAVFQSSRLVLLGLAVLALTGCQTVRSMLKPYVCDCARNPTAQSCPGDTDKKQADSEPATLMARSQQATSTAVERARAEAELEADDKPALRTLDRAQQDHQPQGDPLDVVDPVVYSANVADDDTATQDRLQETYGVAFPESADAVVLTGNFSPEEGDEMVVVEAGKELTVYGADARIARVDLPGSFAPQAFADLGVDMVVAGPQAVRMVQDGTLQILMGWQEKTDKGAIAYKVGIFKVIGSFVGRAFVRTIATRDQEGGELVQKGAFEVLRGQKNRAIRWIPADADGQLQTDQAVVLQWNHWEGVYRVPKPPPTAPKPEKLQSARPAAPARQALVHCSACLNASR